ncbi:MAG: EMC3/TMCO1 family protein [Candidatus Woesearchaeota archaeon]
MFDNILDAIFGPIASLPSILAIAIFALIVTLITTFIYKLVTDQKKLKELKTRMKSYQDEMKRLSKDDPEKALGVQKKAMSLNMEYMKHSMKATLFTIIPVLIIFTWLNANLAFYPIVPNQEFDVYAEFKEGAQGTAILDITPSGQVEFISPRETEIVDGKATWSLKGSEGKYLLSYTHESETQQQDLIISEKKYAPPNKEINQGNFVSGNIVNEKVMPLSFIGLKWGWLGAYILFSVIMGMTLRKIMGIS